MHQFYLFVSYLLGQFKSQFKDFGYPVLLTLTIIMSAYSSFGQCVSLSTLGSAATQDFNTLSNTAGSTTNNLTITGWFMTETGGGARDNEQYAVDNGASTTGDTYSYGAVASTDRAIGSLRSGTLITSFGSCFTNNTGSTIASFTISYTGEQWRLGTAARTDQLDFQYSLNATSLTTGTWVDVNALDFITPNTATVGAKDGNAVGNRTTLAATIAGLSIPNGVTFWIRWNDADATSADDGLAVDDFSLTPNGAPSPPDYTINTAGNNIIITDVAGNGETIALSESGSNVRFVVTPTTRTYSINGGATTAFTTPADVALAGANSITINSAAGNDIINIGAFTAPLPSLTINGGTGDDAVNFNGDLSFLANANLDVDMQNDDPSPGIDQVAVATNTNLILSGTGAATLKVSRNVIFNNGGSLSTMEGDLNIEANQQIASANGEFAGIFLQNTTLSSNTGIITLRGHGGNQGFSQIGIHVNNSTIESASGEIELYGHGGPGTSQNYGIILDASILHSTNPTANNTNLRIHGFGGIGAGILNEGVRIVGESEILSAAASIDIYGSGVSSIGASGVHLGAGGKILGTNSASISIYGEGTNNFSSGVFVDDGDCLVSSEDGEIIVTGRILTPFAGYYGIQIGNSSSVGNASIVSTNSSISLITDILNIDPRGSVNAGNNLVVIKPLTISGTTPIILGQASNDTHLGVTNSHLNQITAGTLIIGDPTSGKMTISSAITLPSAMNVELRSGGDIEFLAGFNTSGGTLLLSPGTAPAAVKPTFNGTNVVASTLSFAGNLAIVINGTTPGNGAGSTYSHLTAVGGVNLTNANLVLSGIHLPLTGQSFTIVINDGVEPIVGNFNGLAEGASVTNFLNSGLNAQISYIGGDGNDVVLTVLDLCPLNNTFVVNSIGDSSDDNPGDGVCNDGSGNCTLRAAIQEANALKFICSPLFITFSVTGIINLLSTLPDIVHPNISIQGPGADLLTLNRESGGNYRLLTIEQFDGVANVSGLTFTNGNSENFGGAIFARGSIIDISDCIFSGNYAYSGGALGITFGIDLMTINRCILENNTAIEAAGIYLQDNNNVQIQNSIIRNNLSYSSGCVINRASFSNSSLTMVNCLVADNIAYSLDAGIRSGGQSGRTSSINLVNCTVTRNNTINPGQPGAIYQLQSGVTHSLTVHNSIVTGNISGGAVSDFTAVLEPSSSNNLVGVGSGLTHGVNGNLVGVDPLFFDAEAGNYRLQDCSPAVNAGDNDAVPSGINTDLNNNPRFYNNGTVDIGAYELQGLPLSVNAICQNTSVFLDESGNATLTATSIDNGSTGCAVLEFSINSQPSVSYSCENTGFNIVIMQVTDGFGKVSSCSALITVEDQIIPTINCPLDQSILLDMSCSASLPDYTGLATTGDNCGVQGITQSPSAGTTVSASGDMTVTLTVTDVNDLTNTCSFTLTKVDNTPPTITCPATQELALGNNCSSSLPDYTTLAMSGDNCGIDEVTQTPLPDTTVSGLGDMTVILAVTDVNGLTNTCSFTVTKVDNTPPSIACPSNQELVLDSECSASLPDYKSLVTPDDNCGIQGLEQTPLSGTSVSETGEMIVILTATDVNGISNSCTFTVAKVDNTPPAVECFNQTINFNGETNIPLDPNDLVEASDNCGIQNISLSPASVNSSQVGQTVPVLVTVTDINGNSSTCTSQVSLSGLPPGWSQNNNGVGCANGNDINYNPSTEVWTATSTNCYYSSPFTSDQTGFAQRTLCGNGSITAEITGISGTALGWAGIVMRESNAPGAKKVQVMTNLSNFLRREVRTVTNGPAAPQQFPSQNRYWLRLVRTGNQIVGFSSNNGINWFQAIVVNVPMNSCIEMGLVVTNYNPNSTVTATFENVSFTGNGIETQSINSNNNNLAASANIQPDFSVYPNPTSGELNIDLKEYTGKNVQIELYSMEGKLMQMIQLDEVLQNTQSMLLDRFASGMYFVKLKSAGLPDVTKRVVLVKN